MTVTNLLSSYVHGSLKVERIDHERFRLEGNYSIHTTHMADHFQLIYEALEIAANSDDKFRRTFEAMRDEFMALTADWDETAPPESAVG